MKDYLIQRWFVKKGQTCTRLELNPCFFLHITSESYRKFPSQRIYRTLLIPRAFNGAFFFSVGSIKFVFDLKLDKIQSLQLSDDNSPFLLRVKVVSQLEIIFPIFAVNVSWIVPFMFRIDRSCTF